MSTVTTTDVYADRVIGAGQVHDYWKQKSRFTGEDGTKMVRMQRVQKTAAGRVIFHCPNCEARNNRALMEGKDIDNDKLGFTCHSCHFTVPVKPPVNL